MAVVYYNNPQEYISSSMTPEQRIARISAVIVALENAMITGATTANMEEFSFDDGQSKIMTKYRNPSEMVNTLKTLDAILNRLINQMHSRRFILRDVNSALIGNGNSY